MNHHKITHTGWRKGKDKTTFVLVCLFSLVAMFPLFFILWDVISKGYKNFNLRLFTEVTPSSMDAMLARMNGEPIPGGILNGITGTVLIVGMAILFSVFLGLFIGIYLADNRGKRFAGVVSYLTDLLQGMPSIVIGIIAYAWIVKPLGGYSALAGSVALTIMMLPMIVRSTEETLKMLPVAYKEAGLALGSSYTSVVFRILIPSGFGGNLYRYTPCRITCDGRDRSTDAYRTRSVCSELESDGTHQCNSTADLGFLQRPELSRFDLVIVAPFIDRNIPVKLDSQNCST